MKAVISIAIAVITIIVVDNITAIPARVLAGHAKFCINGHFNFSFLHCTSQTPSITSVVSHERRDHAYSPGGRDSPQESFSWHCEGVSGQRVACDWCTPRPHSRPPGPRLAAADARLARVLPKARGRAAHTANHSACLPHSNLPPAQSCTASRTCRLRSAT